MVTGGEIGTYVIPNDRSECGDLLRVLIDVGFEGRCHCGMHAFSQSSKLNFNQKTRTHQARQKPLDKERRFLLIQRRRSFRVLLKEINIGFTTRKLIFNCLYVIVYISFRNGTFIHFNFIFCHYTSCLIVSN